VPEVMVIAESLVADGVYAFAQALQCTTQRRVRCQACSSAWTCQGNVLLDDESRSAVRRSIDAVVAMTQKRKTSGNTNIKTSSQYLARSCCGKSKRNLMS